jgi:hypothetical protein
MVRAAGVAPCERAGEMRARHRHVPLPTLRRRAPYRYRPSRRDQWSRRVTRRTLRRERHADHPLGQFVGPVTASRRAASRGGDPVGDVRSSRHNPITDEYAA